MKNFMERLAFHRSGKPRGWLRSIIIRDKIGTPRSIARRILFKKNGKVREKFNKWYRMYDGNPQNEKILHYVHRLSDVEKNADFRKVKTLHIVSTKHTEFLADALEVCLRGSRLEVSKGASTPLNDDFDLYVVIAPQMFDHLPPPNKLVIFQVEQVRASNWVDDRYLELLRQSLMVLDYSRDNIAALMNLGIVAKSIFYVPIRPIQKNYLAAERDIDFLFYGATGSERRMRYLEALSKRFNVRIESDCFGEKITNLLSRTKVVLNVHFYENFLLETTRLSEAISCGARVVSEKGVDQLISQDAFFSQWVDFAEINDLQGFIRLAESQILNWGEPTTVVESDNFDGMKFHALRAFQSIGVYSLDEVQSLCSSIKLPSSRIVLALPEQFSRYEYARRNLIPQANIFHGLRHIEGWKGCANSYKFIARQALASGLDRLTIYEDDAFFPKDSIPQLERIERYLRERPEDWDVFTGLLTDLPTTATIKSICDIEGDEFIELDKIIGLVFCIYNRSALEIMAKFEFEGDDTSKHTIDRFLESKNLRVITTWPQLVEHSVDFNSTIWPVSNAHASSMIEKSTELLHKKRKEWRITPVKVNS